jgi:cytochrome c553
MREWKKGFRGKDPNSDDVNTMQPIAHALTDMQMKETAAYLSHQK